MCDEYSKQIKKYQKAVLDAIFVQFTVQKDYEDFNISSYKMIIMCHKMLSYTKFKMTHFLWLNYLNNVAYA
jgi:hypothetical protein